MSPDEVSALLYDYTIEPWQHGNFEPFERRIGDGWALLPHGGTVEDMEALIVAYRSGLPDVKVTIEEVIADGDAVAYRWTMAGTHLGELDGIAPTGKPIVDTGITILHVRDGKVVDDRFEAGGPSVAVQVGG